MLPSTAIFVFSLIITSSARAACTANNSSTTDLQALLRNGGRGYTLSLCAGQVFNLTSVLNYTNSSQEISTEGYPRDTTRATLLVGGFNQTTAVQASNAGLDNIKLRNIQINGNRGESPIYTAPNANIEIGGENSNQLVEYVKTYNPRGWSCLHIAEGPYKCRNATIQYNDIGPCGSDAFQEWSDGVSLSCQSSLVQHNTIVDATDGGIVIFGSPNSTIRNNTISVKTRTLLGGINMVDVLPWLPEGNFSGVIVDGNHIYGGFATEYGNDTVGKNSASAMIKIGLAIGPRVWFSDGRYGTNRTMGAVVQNNVFSGAFAFAMGVSSAQDYTIQNNSFTGNVSFIGSYGPNCTSGAETPAPPVPLLLEQNSTRDLTISVPAAPSPLTPQSSQYNLTTFTHGIANGLTCVIHPDSNALAWPYGGGGVNAQAPSSTPSVNPSSATSGVTTTSNTGEAGTRVGIPRDGMIGGPSMVLGAVIGGLIILGI